MTDAKVLSYGIPVDCRLPHVFQNDEQRGNIFSKLIRHVGNEVVMSPE